MSEPNATRRTFLQTTAAAAGTLAATAYVSGDEAKKSPKDKLRIAVIGCGGRGGSNLKGVSSEEIVALCDVNQQNLSRAKDAHPKARTVIDYRHLYDNADDFDAVVVSTPEHTHAFATLPALQLGKHVYCEKPLTHSVYEARVIREAAVKAGVATQMGTQIHAGDNYRRAVEIVHSGAIGPVRECHVWVDRAWGRQSKADAERNNDRVYAEERPTTADPIPEGLNWDLWLGPAPYRPFNNVYFPGSKWYRWWDFGNGTMSDLGSHWIDLAFWALKLESPLTIEASGPPPHAEIAPASMQVKYEYGARGDMPAVDVHWYQGDNKPKIWTDGKIPQWRSGVLFVGDNGMLLSDYGKHMILLDQKVQEFQRPEPFIPKSLGHHAEWIHAAKTGAPTTCNFEYAGWLTEANHLGNVAYRTGKKLEWDAAAMKATNAPEADQFIRREYRDGWSLT
ncbi:Gfo/Idh/MocA family protein [Fuerstiella marisgermanici]|uniref:Inositol 2-dehydrogenase n=1 Tax=Fuerstiella marisgermanici TaxID=1891926 RepID=A0A1P8WMK4_9PLAN|nr:Gfo/Idh/MocA family oxidoreductase [Fuerstiella marisgermanici]APZ95284.1 Inositol 2-dehydrogenase [Fuerstiella marisgermanici]